MSTHLDGAGLLWSSVFWLPVVAALVILLVKIARQFLFSTLFSREMDGPARCSVLALACSACVALRFTWGYMLRMVADDMALAQSPDFLTWFSTPARHRPHSMLFEAYQLTSLHPVQWWLTSQLIMLAPAFVLFIVAEAAKHRLAHAWAFIWLGFMVALSFGLPLFLCYLVVSVQLARATARPPPASQVDLESSAGSGGMYTALLAACVAVGAASTPLMAALRDGPFNANLMQGHAALVLPALALPAAALLRACCRRGSVTKSKGEGGGEGAASAPAGQRAARALAARALAASPVAAALYAMLAGAALLQHVHATVAAAAFVQARVLPAAGPAACVIASAPLHVPAAPTASAAAWRDLRALHGAAAPPSATTSSPAPVSPHWLRAGATASGPGCLPWRSWAGLHAWAGAVAAAFGASSAQRSVGSDLLATSLQALLALAAVLPWLDSVAAGGSVAGRWGWRAAEGCAVFVAGLVASALASPAAVVPALLALRELRGAQAQAQAAMGSAREKTD